MRRMRQWVIGGSLCAALIATLALALRGPRTAAAPAESAPHTGQAPTAAAEVVATADHNAESHPAAAPHSTPALPEVPAPSHPAAAAATLDPATALRDAEQLLHDGAHRTADELLQRISPQLTGEPAARGAWLRGCAAEADGRLQDACAAYERAAGDARIEPIAAVALARTLHALGRDALAAAVLYRRQLRYGREPDELSAAAWHLLGLVLSRPEHDAASRDPFDDGTLHHSPMIVDRTPLGLDATASPATAVAPLPIGLTVHPFAGGDPLRMPVSWRGDQLVVAAGVQQLAAAMRRSVDWSPGAVRSVAGREFDIHAGPWELGLLLDALLVPLDLEWELRAESVTIVRRSERTATVSTPIAPLRACRVLEQALDGAPQHQWAAASRTALARLYAAAGRTDDALRLLEQSRAESRGRLGPEAHLNEGKLALRTGDRARARACFLRCVDASAAHPVQVVAYAYSGRLSLEEDDPHGAIAALQRALSLAGSPEEESLTAALLASALVLNRKSEGANSVLAAHREALTAGPYRDAAALLASLARRTAATDADHRRRESTAVLEALAHFDPTPLFGDHWRGLAADSARELGLTDEAERWCAVAATAVPSSPVCVRMQAELLYERCRRLPTAQWNESATLPFETGDASARLAGAELLYRRGADAAAHRVCRSVTADAAAAAPARAAALRLLGRIHQQQGDHAAAIACFSGVLPGTRLPAVTPHDLQIPAAAEGHP